MSDRRERFVEKLKNELDVWNAEMDKWEAKMKMANTEVRGEYEDRMEQAQKKKEVVDRKIREVEEAGDSAWEQMKLGLESAWSELETSFQKAKETFQSSEKKESTSDSPSS